MAHLYTFNSFVGLSAGIQLSSGSHPHNPSRTVPLHLSVGLAGFIGLNTRWSNPALVKGKLQKSSLKTLEPHGKKPFMVFDAPRQDDAFSSMIFIDTAVPQGMKRRFDADLDAWCGFRGEGFKVIKVDTSTGTALLSVEPNASIELFQFDGAVHQLLVSNGSVSTVRLTQSQMARLRVEQFEDQIAGLDLSTEAHLRRLHGIFGSALRLVKAAKDSAALDVLVDFLSDKQASLTDNLRKQIRYELSDRSHPAYGTFVDGFEAANVVKLTGPEAAAKRAAVDRKRAQRANDDRELRQRMKGASNGQSQSKQTPKKQKGK